MGRLVDENYFPIDYENTEPKKITNFERIKAMSVDEMAVLLETPPCGLCKLYEKQTCDNTPCVRGVRQWLESEVDTE